MARSIGWRCTRCGRRWPTNRDYFGCPRCAEDVPANLAVEYDGPAFDERARAAWAGRPPSLWRYAEALPVAAANAVSLGEGGTPLIACERIGEELGLPRLLVKAESHNPTWSFKDRLASVAVSWAAAAGRGGVVLSSSGNAGAAAAAYAARANLPCIVFTTPQFPATMRRFMESYEAMVVPVPRGPDRWVLNRAVAGEWGWLPVSNAADPPVGSHPVGVEGHKTIAFEIAEQLGWEAPDAVVIPVAYGDAIAGIGRGFAELRGAGLLDRVPRLIAAETYPSLGAALASGGEAPVDTGGGGSIAFSAAAPRGTYQALAAVRATGGDAVRVDDDAIRAAHRRLRRDGMLVELSSAMPLAAAAEMARDGRLGEDDRVVLLATSSGLKDTELSAPAEDVPVIEPDMGALTALLARRYGFHA